MAEHRKYWLEIIHSKVGTGDTAKKATMENYWEAVSLPTGTFKMILLDDNYQQTGYSEEVPASDLGARFTALPEDFEPPSKDLTKQQSDRITARAERHLAKQEYHSAEFEFNNALKLNESNVRANFGLGKTYLAMGETEKAKETFQKLAAIDAVLNVDNRHIFNEFGIQLRKMGMFDEALGHYERALSLSPEDENLWFNKGRCYFEAGKTKEALNALKKALEINKNFTDAKQFLLYMKQSLKPNGRDN